MKKLWKAGVIAGGLLLAGCGSLETTEVPAITGKPKVNIVEPATPTPTITLEEGEVPPVSEAPETIEPAATATPTPEPVATAAPTATPKPTNKPTATPVPTKAAPKEYEKGVLTENSLTSTWMGLKFVAPKGAELSTQKELDATMRLIEEAVRGEELPKELDYEDLSIVYEMELTWQDEGMVMTVLVEKIPESTTVEDYAKQLQKELYLLEESGLTYTVDDKLYSEKIGGLTFSNFGYTTYYDTVGMRQENYFRKQGDHMILITLMCEADMVDNIPKLLDAFKPN